MNTVTIAYKPASVEPPTVIENVVRISTSRHQKMAVETADDVVIVDLLSVYEWGVE